MFCVVQQNNSIQIPISIPKKNTYNGLQHAFYFVFWGDKEKRCWLLSSLIPNFSAYIRQSDILIYVAKIRTVKVNSDENLKYAICFDAKYLPYLGSC